VITRVTESPVFTRSGDNLEVEVPLTIPEALLGGIIEVPTLKANKRLKVARGTRSGSVQRLRGEGPPKLNGKGRGDIHYRFVLDVPSSLDSEQTAAVERFAQTLKANPREQLMHDSAPDAREPAGEAA
jgi:molecular chaperone DnaJ